MALEVVTDYLAPAMADRLLKVYNMSASDLNSKTAAAANLKRKADWEQELEVNNTDNIPVCSVLLCTV